jgi:hypothetical protein
MSIVIQGKRWFFFLRSKEGRKGLDPKEQDIIVCRQYEKSRCFTSYSSVGHLLALHRSTPSKERCFYELVRGDRRQKIYFDIDIEVGKKNKKKDIGDKGDKKEDRKEEKKEEMIEVTVDNLDRLLHETREYLLRALIDVCSELKIALDPAEIDHYTSHGSLKRSLHLITANISVQDAINNREVYHRCLQKVPPRYHPFIDHGVYSSIQQIRLLGSQKIGTERPKKALNSFTFEGKLYLRKIPDGIAPEMEKLYLLERSLIERAANTMLLPNLIPPKEIEDSGMNLDLVIAEEDCKDVIGRVNNKLFEFREIKQGVICFKRIAAGFCTICKRRHDHENAYAVITKRGEIRFYCRRAAKGQRFKFLGQLHSNFHLPSASEISEVSEQRGKSRAGKGDEQDEAIKRRREEIEIQNRARDIFRKLNILASDK